MAEGVQQGPVLVGTFFIPYNAVQRANSRMVRQHHHLFPAVRQPTHSLSCIVKLAVPFLGPKTTQMRQIDAAIKMEQPPNDYQSIADLCSTTKIHGLRYERPQHRGSTPKCSVLWKRSIPLLLHGPNGRIKT